MYMAIEFFYCHLKIAESAPAGPSPEHRQPKPKVDLEIFHRIVDFFNKL